MEVGPAASPLLTPTLLISQLDSVSGVTVVTQKPPVVTRRTLWTVTWGLLIIETDTLDCNLGTVDNITGWYKQVPGGVPQYVLRWYHTGWTSVEYGSGFSSSVPVLLVERVKLCLNGMFQFLSSHVVFGQGTKLIVTDGDLATPAVTLFPPSTEDLKSSRATLVCLTSNLSQKSKGLADVSWMSNGESVTEDVSTSPAEQQPDKTFKISSYLTIQTADWDKDLVFTCKVSLGSTFSEKEIRKTSCSL
ncbi:immunoglobulin lambda-1 light chain-like [Salvelinus alpinus]|uniref:immunoglobulin lambda-1 light chain-like n=1 Tax=Salvelinus alpinus TaxID=8036 RepID=UPI0039FC42A1